MQQPIKFDLSKLIFVQKLDCQNKYTKIRILLNPQTNLKIVQKIIQVAQQQNKKYAILEQYFMDSLKSQFVVQLIHSEERILQGNRQALALYMEYYQNGDLDKYLQQKKLGLFQRIEIFFQILIGLKDLHKKYIIHRDLKLSNIFVTKNGTIKIGDLGVVKQNARGVAMSYVGTFGYQAPQIFTKEKDSYNDNVDVWSLGFLAFQLLNQQYHQGGFRDPFLPLNKVRRILDSLNFQEKIIQYKKILQKPLIFDQKIPDFLKDLIRKMLQSDPLKRISFNQMYENNIFQQAQIKGSKYLNQIKKFKNIYAQIRNQKKKLQQKRNQYLKLYEDFFSKMFQILSKQKKISDIKFYKLYYLITLKMKQIYSFFKEKMVIDQMKQFYETDQKVDEQFDKTKRKLDVHFRQNKQELCQNNKSLKSQETFVQLKKHFNQNYKK